MLPVQKSRVHKKAGIAIHDTHSNFVLKMLKAALVMPCLLTSLLMVHCTDDYESMPPLELPSLERLTERLPYPFCLHPRAYDVDPPRMAYYLELTLESRFLDNGDFWDMDASYLERLSRMNPKVYLRFTKKLLLKTNTITTPGEDLIKIREVAMNLIKRDEEINELLEEVPLPVDTKAKLVGRLSDGGRLIRAARDGDVGLLSKRIETAARQGDIDAAFIDSVERYQAAVNAESRNAVDKVPVLELLSLHASEKAIEAVHPSITASTSEKIKRGRKTCNNLESSKTIKP